MYTHVISLQKPEEDDASDKDILNVIKQPKETVKVLTSSAPPTQPGHTGFLTFATLPPAFAR